MEGVAASVAAAPREDGKMKSLSDKFLTADEQQLITETVQQAEKTTSGEIVPMIVSKSDDYPLATVICSVSLAVPIALLLTHLLGKAFWLGPQNMYLFLTIFTLLFSFCYLFTSRTNYLRHYFFSSRDINQEVREAAFAAFYHEKLYKTEAENGILLYISVLEKRVWILADRGISDKIEQSAWDSIVAELTSGILAGNQCEAICAAIIKIGQILSKHFPYQRDDQDELHNLIVR